MTQRVILEGMTCMCEFSDEMAKAISPEKINDFTMVVSEAQPDGSTATLSQYVIALVEKQIAVNAVLYATLMHHAPEGIDIEEARKTAFGLVQASEHAADTMVFGSQTKTQRVN